MHPITRPFRDPLRCRPLLAELPLHRSASPTALLAALRARGHRGLVLLESAEPGCGRSLLVTRPLLRLALRGSELAVTPFDARMRPLAAALARVPMPQRPPAAELDDGERLAAYSVLDPLRVAATALVDVGHAPLPPGIFGALGFDLVDRFETLPPRPPDPLDEPDYSFVLAGDLVQFDHARGRVDIVVRQLPGEHPDEAAARRDELLALLRTCAAGPELPPAPTPLPAAAQDPEFVRRVAILQDHLRAGDIFQCVLSRRFELGPGADPLTVYRLLRARNPSPYLFFLDLGDGVLLGSSPETCLRVGGGFVEIRPIAGTAPRGSDPEQDGRLGTRLLLDPKEQAEHAMLLDLARNDVARLSEPGSVEVVRAFALERFVHVQHLVSHVRGRLRPGLDALHAYQAAANMGTLTGAPKLRAIELIRAHEATARGFYGGAAGYLLADGRFDSCIVIRALREKHGRYTTRAGAGIVLDSDPLAELAETEHKARACREVVA